MAGAPPLLRAPSNRNDKTENWKQKQKKEKKKNKEKFKK